MHHSNLAIATALLAAGSLFAQVPAPKSPPSSKTGVRSASHRKSTHRSSSAKSAPKPAVVTASNKPAAATNTAHRASKSGGSKSAGSKSGKKPVTAVARRSNQQQPTPDRYREIQQALSGRGYFAGQPDGNWGPESVDALKRFQHDQNLTEDGKLGALSLIALGLGPRRLGTEEIAVEAAPPEKSAPEKQLEKPAH